jgi:hypothetical protein
VAAQERGDAVAEDLGGVFAGHGQRPFADQPGAEAGAEQDARQILLDVVGLAFFDDEDRILVAAEGDDLVVDLPQMSARPIRSSARMTPLYMPPWRMMPTLPSAGPKRSLSLRSRMNLIAAGRRWWIFCCSWA